MPHTNPDPVFELLLPGIPVTSNRGALGWCNVALIRTATANILFDTGAYGDRQLLLDQLAERRLTARDVDFIFVSHFHYDHVVNAEIFPDTKILLSEREFDYIVREEYKSAADPFVPLAMIGCLAERLEQVSDGQYIADGVRAVLLPGHTPGNTALLLEDSATLLTGDAVKNAWEFVNNVAPPSFFSPEESLKTYRTVRQISRIVVPGHDRPFKLLDNGSIEYIQKTTTTLNLYPDPHGPVQSLKLL